MAGKKRAFSVNSNRVDPFRNFKFRMAVASALGAVAGLGLLKRLFGGPATTRKFTDQAPGEIKEVLASMGRRLGMDIPGWPPENIEEMAKKLEQEMLG